MERQQPGASIVSLTTSIDSANVNMSNSISKSENGWTDASLGLAWLREVFDPQTRDKANGLPRFILLDGHSSHYSLEFIEYARQNNIILLGYPPHCTHALQGLDVVSFAIMKQAWREEIEAFEEQHKRPVSKADFTCVFGKAYIRSFTPEPIKAAFRVTGVYPFDPTVISEKQMKPSLTTSVKGSFPLAQASPVRAVMAAFTRLPTDSFASPQTSQTDGNGNTPQTLYPPSPLSKKRHRCDVIDPSLLTPSKRMRALHANLSATSSGSILVSTAKATSSTLKIIPPVLESAPNLPEPDWNLAKMPLEPAYMTRNQLINENTALKSNLEHAQLQVHARDAMLEGAHAQLIVQNLSLQKLNQALFNKENRKTNDRALLFDGRAQVLSSDTFTAKISDAAQKRDAETAKRAENAQMRVARKQAMDALEEEWGHIKAEHEEAVRAWSVICDGLKAKGVAKKEWPKKPIRARKPKAPAALIEEEACEDGVEQEADVDEDV